MCTFGGGREHDVAHVQRERELKQPGRKDHEQRADEDELDDGAARVVSRR
jgi:hypothetical protein